ncbi:hypothetical protein Pa4123_28490 [Phytohabitans aurantiacus]|uniref:Uncharacterized protein n=1 Tax=Phytohabitans aurantiacus TaxID=3016789 RepID=A0ABQ5QV22_9ACTN|nr:hypothetical protein Pa4123_28490 [Phytohabitans aurantiacus]
MDQGQVHAEMRSNRVRSPLIGGDGWRAVAARPASASARGLPASTGCGLRAAGCGQCGTGDGACVAGGTRAGGATWGVWRDAGEGMGWRGVFKRLTVGGGSG